MKETPWILVVDDDLAILAMVKELLKPDYLVDPVTNVKEAQERLQSRGYDLVLTDMVMPELGGMELLKHMRLHYSDIPVIVFTGYANFQDAVNAVKLGAFDYLTKPIQIEILRHAIFHALEFRRLSKVQKDLEVIFQGAEALGWQALDLISNTPEAAVLAKLKAVDHDTSIHEVGHRFLEGARQLIQARRSSIFLYNHQLNQLVGIGATGAEADARAALTVPITEGIMGYVATQRRPLLVTDILHDPRFSEQSGRSPYLTHSFMIIPLLGRKFWGVINLADQQNGQPFSARSLFLGWLLGRLFVEILEAREPQEDLESLKPVDSLLSEHIPLGLALLGQDLKVVQTNYALGRLVGVKASSLVGQDIVSRLGLSARDQDLVKRAFRELVDNQAHKELPSLKSVVEGKGVRFLSIKMFPSVLSPEVTHGFILVEDVTEQEQLKQRLHLYEHLAIMGKLSLCVAHELNNPLDGIRRYLSLAQRKKTEPQEVERYLGEAQKGLQKMSLTINSLLSSANPLKAPRASDSLYNLLQDAIKIMMFQASDQRVEVVFHPSPELRQIRVEGDVYHVFINLIKNALQAMPQGGVLKVDGFIGETEVQIVFEDTGPGLSSEEMNNIFQPFYSTKEGTQGLGLGLPICRKILERYSGKLTLESQPGQGTRVMVILPKSIMGGHLAA